MGNHSNSNINYVLIENILCIHYANQVWPTAPAPTQEEAKVLEQVYGVPFQNTHTHTHTHTNALPTSFQFDPTRQRQLRSALRHYGLVAVSSLPPFKKYTRPNMAACQSIMSSVDESLASGRQRRRIESDKSGQ